MDVRYKRQLSQTPFIVAYYNDSARDIARTSVLGISVHTRAIRRLGNMDLEGELMEHEQRITKLEASFTLMATQIAKIEGSTSTVEILIKWIILPLLVIVGGLVGIKIISP